MEKEVRAMIEKGEKVILIHIQETDKFCVKDKEYEVVDFSSTRVFIIDEQGSTHSFTYKNLKEFFKLKQPKDPNELIGRKVKGFRFEDTESGIVFPEQMNELIGFKGEILRLTLDEDGYVVSFKKPYHCEFTYPADQIEAHLLPEKKTKKERIEELEKRVEQLESDFKDFCSYVEFKILEPDSSDIQKQNIEDAKSMVNDKYEL